MTNGSSRFSLPCCCYWVGPPLGGGRTLARKTLKPARAFRRLALFLRATRRRFGDWSSMRDGAAFFRTSPGSASRHSQDKFAFDWRKVFPRPPSMLMAQSKSGPCSGKDSKGFHVLARHDLHTEKGAEQMADHQHRELAKLITLSASSRSGSDDIFR
jgi:hypothetical protein